MAGKQDLETAVVECLPRPRQQGLSLGGSLLRLIPAEMALFLTAPDRNQQMPSPESWSGAEAEGRQILSTNSAYLRTSTRGSALVIKRRRDQRPFPACSVLGCTDGIA